ncbi:unnamed protein product, partial [Durusdinium trenchii]
MEYYEKRVEMRPSNAARLMMDTALVEPANSRPVSPMSGGREDSPHVAPARRRQASSPVRLSACRHQLNAGGARWQQGHPASQRPPPTEGGSQLVSSSCRARMDSVMTFGGSLPLPPVGSLVPSREDQPIGGDSLLPEEESEDRLNLPPEGSISPQNLPPEGSIQLQNFQASTFPPDDRPTGSFREGSHTPPKGILFPPQGSITAQSFPPQGSVGPQNFP